MPDETLAALPDTPVAKEVKETKAQRAPSA